MLICTFRLTGVSDLMFGSHVAERKRDDESHDQFEERTWQQKVHNINGECFLQPFALKNCLESAAKWIGLKMPGEGKKNYTQRFLSGILVTEKLMLTKANGKPVTLDDVRPVRLFAPSDGKRGGSKRVFRIFPTITEWTTVASVHVFDNKITADILTRHLVEAGKFIGFGSMRVQNGGINGRFAVSEFVSEKIEDVQEAMA